MPSPNQQLGTWGEDKAADYLTRKGYQIVDRNYHAQGGEIDIVAKKDLPLLTGEGTEEVYILVEVKTRRSNQYGEAKDAVEWWKLKRIIKASTHYFLFYKRMEEIPPFQIDIIAIDVDVKQKTARLEHLENVGVDN